jgi:D-alanyl-D-alanine-carboxypeptidase/D-alanyl-D-alanine-endopeptidase
MDTLDTTVDPARFTHFAGTYDFRPSGPPIKITREADHLYAQFGETPRHEIFPASPTAFFWKEINAQITFNAAPGGSVESATVHVPGGKDVTGRRTETVP